MTSSIKILGIAGSLRKASYNRAALRAAQGLVPAGATLDVFDIAGLPGFNQDDEQNPPAKVTELKARIRAADAILFVTAEYNPRGAEERHRLGLPPVWRQRLERQTGGGDGLTRSPS
jgi:hypothetical protein